MKRIEISSDRYYELRHELEADYHEDFDYSNAVADGEIISMEVENERILTIMAKTINNHNVTEDYYVRIKYQKGKWGPKSNKEMTRAVGIWFEKKPETGFEDVSYENCVFDTEVKLNGCANVSFTNCFFLHSVEVNNSKGSYRIGFEHCIIKNNLIVSDSDTEELFIRNCNIFWSIDISNCKVKTWTSIFDLYVKQGLCICDSYFYGHEFMLNRIKTGYAIELLNSNFDVSANIGVCKTEGMRVKDTSFKDLYMHHLATNKRQEYEELNKVIADSSDTRSHKIITYEGQDEGGLSPREWEFDHAINKAVDEKCAILITDTDFTGSTEFLGINTTLLGICGCRVYDEFRIEDNRPYLIIDPEDSCPSPFYEQAEGKYDVQFLDLSGTIFYEDVDILNIYRFIRLNNTRFKENCYIDVDYLNLTKGHVIRRLSNKRRLIDEAPQTINELCRSCNRDDQESKMELFLNAKTIEREESSRLEKLGYYAHEMFSNYGKSPIRVLITIFYVIALFSIAFLVMDYGIIDDCITNSFSSFFTIGLSITGMEDQATKALMIAEGATGTILMAYFVVVLCDRKKY